MKNKKIGLLTLDSKIYNYGGILQEYALWKYIQNLGYDCEIIDYDLKSENYTFSLKRSIFNFSINKLIKRKNVKKNKEQKDDIDVNEVINIRKRLFDKFRENMKYSERVKVHQLSKLQKNYSSIICGSDQIWNPDYNVPSFFLTFVTPPAKSIIYAASIGKENLTKHQLRIYRKLMKNLDFISVREKSAQQLLKSKMPEYSIDLVLDPTLLLTTDIWTSLANKVDRINSKYVFCYFLENNVNKKNAVSKYAKENGYKLISIPYLHGKYCIIDDEMSDIKLDVGPIQFLNLIYNAETVITDSFHATVFSIIFNKRFRVFGRQCGNYDMNTRVITLLSYFGLSDCLIQPSELDKEIIHYETKDEEFKKILKTSIDYLKNAIE